MLKGVGASAGIGIGKVICIREQNLDYSQVQYQGREQEKARLKQAVETFCEKTQRMAEDIRQRVGQKESEILSGQVMMLSDPFMVSQMEDAIQSGSCAEAAVDTVCQMYIEMFSNVEDELMKQRATDIGDIKTRMLRLLLGVESVDMASLPKGTVLAAKDLTPSMTVGLQKENVSAIITEVGGKTSHSAILARALEIPAVLGIPDALQQLTDGQTAIVDGATGQVLTEPGCGNAVPLHQAPGGAAASEGDAVDLSGQADHRCLRQKLPAVCQHRQRDGSTGCSGKRSGRNRAVSHRVFVHGPSGYAG